MNEQNNVTLIKKLYAAFGQGDLKVILDNLSPDVEWEMEGPAVIPYAGKRTGIEGAREFFTALGTTQQNQSLTIDNYIAQGDYVATTGRYAALVTATGKKFDSAVAHVFTIKDGRVTKFIDFGDTAMMADAYSAASASAAV